jgi:hypothetical protein
MNSFRIIFSDYFSFDELKHVLIYLGKMYEVEVKETVHKNRHGYTYIIHMESWTKAGEYFRTALLDRPIDIGMMTLNVIYCVSCVKG